jgi:hypothetical protein
MELVREYWLLILIVIAIALVAAFLLLRPRQRVQLSNETAPLRPHMMQAREPSGERRGIAAEAAAAASDVTGEIINAPVHANLPGASGPPDDLQRLKGVGPKFAATLNQLGILPDQPGARPAAHSPHTTPTPVSRYEGRQPVPPAAGIGAALDRDALQQRAERHALRQRGEQRAAGEGHVPEARCAGSRQRNSKATPRNTRPSSIAMISGYSAGRITA